MAVTALGVLMHIVQFSETDFSGNELIGRLLYLVWLAASPSLT